MCRVGLWPYFPSLGELSLLFRFPGQWTEGLAGLQVGDRGSEVGRVVKEGRAQVAGDPRANANSPVHWLCGPGQVT